MDLFNSGKTYISAPPSRDTLGQSFGRGMLVSVGTWFGLSLLVTYLHLPASLPGQVLILMLVSLAFLTMATGAKAGRILQTVVLAAFKGIGMALFWVVKMIFSGIAQLINRKSTPEQH